MSANKKKGPSKHCRIFLWVEKIDPDLADAIRILCMEGALSPGRGVGITFLYPKDEATRKTIVTKAYSDDAEEAIKMLEGLILPDVFRDAADFKQKTVGSRLGVQLQIKSATGGEIVLENGAKLSKPASFKPLRENIAVWIIDGDVPTEGPEYAAPRRPKRGKSTTGGSVGAGAGGVTLRARIGHKVESDAFSQAGQFADPYLSCATSLLNFLSRSHPDLFQMVLPIIDWNPIVTFYLVLEPHKRPGTGDYLIPDAVVGEWGGTPLYEDALSEYQQFFAEIPKQTQATATDPNSGSPVVPWAFRDPKKVAEMTDPIRRAIAGDSSQINKLGPPRKVLDTYAKAMSTNTFAGLSPVFPDSTVQAISGVKKLWQDELRFFLHATSESLRFAPTFDPNDFKSMILLVSSDRPGNDYDKELALTNIQRLKVNVEAKHEVGLLVRFVNSDNFLYSAKPASAISESNGMTYEFGPELFDQFYPADAYKKRFLQGTSVPKKPLVDPKTIIQLREHYKRHGAWPADLGIQ